MLRTAAHINYPHASYFPFEPTQKAVFCLPLNQSTEADLVPPVPGEEGGRTRAGSGHASPALGKHQNSAPSTR